MTMKSLNNQNIHFGIRNVGRSSNCSPCFRYLYPYELYIHGKDFREFVPHIEGGKDEAAKKRRRKSTKKRQKMTRHSPNQQHGLKGAWTTIGMLVWNLLVVMPLSVLAHRTELPERCMRMQQKIARNYISLNFSLWALRYMW